MLIHVHHCPRCLKKLPMQGPCCRPTQRNCCCTPKSCLALLMLELCHDEQLAVHCHPSPLRRQSFCILQLLQLSCVKLLCRGDLLGPDPQFLLRLDGEQPPHSNTCFIGSGLLYHWAITCMIRSLISKHLGLELSF